MDNSFLNIEELRTDFLFTRRPSAVPGDLRPAWRIGLLVLLLNGCCRSARSSFARLHVLNWGISSSKSRENLLAAVNGTMSAQSLIVRFDPFLNRAVDFAIGEGLIKRYDGSKIELTTQGKQLAKDIVAADTAYLSEKSFINAIRFEVSETLVSTMFRLGAAK